MKEHVAVLARLRACTKSRAWAESFDTAQAAWDACNRSDWMIWLIANVIDINDHDETHQKIVQAILEFIRDQPVTADDESRLILIDDWLQGTRRRRDMVVLFLASDVDSLVSYAADVASDVCSGMAESVPGLAAFLRKQFPVVPTPTLIGA